MQLFSQNNDSLAGNPFSVLANGNEQCDSDTTSEADDSAFPISAYDNHDFADLEKRYAHVQLKRSNLSLFTFVKYSIDISRTWSSQCCLVVFEHGEIMCLHVAQG